jgi:hypothetical protein
LDLKPYLYLVIAEAFPTEDAITLLFDHFGLTVRNFGGPEKFAWGSEAWREQKAQALQDHMAANNQTDPLLAAVKQLNPAVDLGFYTAEPAPQPTNMTTTRPQTNNTATTQPQPQYENFDITIDKQQDGRYVIRADYSEGGEALPETFNFPLNSADLLNLLGKLAALSGDITDAEAAGALLREHLLPAQIWTLFSIGWLAAKNKGKNLRVRLRIKPPEIGMLPWEYCFDSELQFLALRREMPIVRYIEQGSIPERVAAPRPARILLASASPSGWDTIDAAGEVAQVRQELQNLVNEGLIEVQVMDHTTWDSLQLKLNTFQPHIFHFIGHGTFKVDSGRGAIVLENEQGGPHELASRTFATQLQSLGVKVVILNACKTAAQSRTDAFMGIAPALVRANIPAVIAMQFAIPQDTAARFARQLYRFLAIGQPLDRAITETRINISGYDEVFWAIPVLFMRAPDGVIWKERT